MLQTSKLRPGLLVHLATSIRGNVSYRRYTTEAAHLLENGQTMREAWDTIKTVEDSEEHGRAIQVRSKCRSVVTAVCAASPNGGLLCLQSRRNDLDAAITEARRLADAFNAGASLTRISVNVWIGEIMSDDVEAIRAINKDMRDMVADMESGIDSLSVEKIRDACNKAQAISSMLTDESKAKIQDAIDVARKVARKIVKAGEVAVTEIDRNTIATLAAARTAFLDLDQQGEIGAVQGAATDVDLSPLTDALSNVKANVAQAVAPDLSVDFE